MLRTALVAAAGALACTGQAGGEAPALRGSPALRRLESFCDVYEVCQCEGGSEESDTVCRTDTCRYSQVFPIWSVCHYLTPKCKNFGSGIEDPLSAWPSWMYCQWANFAAAGTYPGDNNILTAIPKKTYTDKVLASISKVTVFSGKENTLACVEGVVAGVDTSCNTTDPLQLYPGVAEFELALTEGPTGSLPKQLVIPLSVVSRGSPDVLPITEDSYMNRAFQGVGGLTWGFNLNMAQNLSVQLDTDNVQATEGLTPFGISAYAKFQAWKETVAAASWQGGHSIFVGNDVKGDLVTAQMMLKSGHLLAAFIRDVKDACQDATCKATWASYGVFFFSNYGEAATTALANGLISKAGCQRVCRAQRAGGLPSCAC